MNRYIGICAFLITVSLPCLAQDTEPEDPGIVLPPVLLEIEDLQVEEVNAALPADEDQLRPEISIPLPEAEDLYVPEYVFDIPFPDQVGVATSENQSSFTQYLEPGRSPIFSDGQIGVGAPIFVLGDLSLYKLGDEPRFRLRFFHEKLDGYGFRQTGSGFYHSDDLLEGFLSYEAADTGFEVSGGIRESSRGLQRGIDGYSADYESVSHRDIYGSGVFNQQLLPILALSSNFNVTYGSQILSAETPIVGYELTVAPQVHLGLTLDALDLGVDATYTFVSNAADAAPDTGLDHRIEALLMASYVLPSDLRFSLDGGIYWSSGDDTVYPDVKIGAEGRIGTMLTFNTSGGYQVHPYSYQSLWEDAPLLSQSALLKPAYGWEWDGTVQLRPIDDLLITTGLGFSWLQNVVDPAVTPDTVTGLFAYSQREMITLDTAVEIEWDITSVFGIDLSWYGAFIDRPTHDAVQTIDLSFDAEDPAERFGFFFNTGLELYPLEVTIPTIGLGGYYRLSDSVQFYLDVQDVLSPLLTPGRYDWEPYIRPGLRAMLYTKISL